MTTKADKQRIIALQNALRIARHALEAVQHNGARHHIEGALDAISKLDCQTKPTPLAGLLGHERRRP